MADDKGRIRRPCLNDVPALVALELQGFPDVYERHPDRSSGCLANALTDRFEQRVLLLGQFSLVREDGFGTIDSMLIACPTDVAPMDFPALQLDMTTAEGISGLLDPKGAYRYFINLVTVATGGGRLSLFRELLARSLEEGFVSTYFESRLPRFRSWVTGQGLDPGGLVSSELSHLACTYVAAVGRNGRPVDPLLAMYSSCGARPLRLVPNAWPVDAESLGFGMLCLLPNRLLLESGVAPMSCGALELAAAVRRLRTWDCIGVLATGQMPSLAQHSSP